MTDSFDFTSFANILADEAGIISRQYFGQKLDIISKSDDSPVTIADRSIELRLREIVERERPDDGILGEEFDPVETKSGYTWVFDPIDGTKSFTIGRPTFGNLIGLCKDETPILGIINHPILNQRWVGQTGQQTTYNGSPVSCRPCPTLKDAIFGTGSATQISHDDPARLSRIQAATRYSVFQGDCYFYGLMANGMMDAIVEDHLGIYDFVALVPVIEGAGGIITDWNGKPKTLHGDPKVIATGAKNIHAELLTII
jgi:inositol-phosphate phosphatase/L-galactose 1-phosphate phosphatase/histidinol-phosphatase